MTSIVVTTSYPSPPVDEREILRYAGCRGTDGEIEKLLSSCLAEVEAQLSYRACSRLFSVQCLPDGVRLDGLLIPSSSLAAHLKDCQEAVVFAATVGVGIDRLIARYSRISPSRALLLQAIGAERIEALCDLFCAELAKEHPKGLASRFSPGYGDMPLACQKDLFRYLECEKRLGLTLHDSLVMSPSKSVTAVVGLR